jgi:hypothetical protein
MNKLLKAPAGAALMLCGNQPVSVSDVTIDGSKHFGLGVHAPLDVASGSPGITIRHTTDGAVHADPCMMGTVPHLTVDDPAQYIHVAGGWCNKDLAWNIQYVPLVVEGQIAFESSTGTATTFSIYPNKLLMARDAGLVIGGNSNNNAAGAVATADLRLAGKPAAQVVLDELVPGQGWRGISFVAQFMTSRIEYAQVLNANGPDITISCWGAPNCAPPAIDGTTLGYKSGHVPPAPPNNACIGGRSDKGSGLYVNNTPADTFENCGGYCVNFGAGGQMTPCP